MKFNFTIKLSVFIKPLRMEDLITRIPLIASFVFDELDNQSLLKCTEVSKELNHFITNEKLFFLENKEEEEHALLLQMSIHFSRLNKKRLSIIHIWDR